MIDSTQILLIVVVSALTIVLVVIGFQIIFILQEVRKSFQKINKMLDDATVVTGIVSKSATNVSTFTSALSGFLQVFKIFSNKKEDGNAKRSE